MPHPGPDSRWRVPFDESFRVKRAPTHHVFTDAEARLAVASARLDKLQRKLYADDRYSLLLVFQAMDAAGKDGTIRAVMRGVDPAGCHVTAFKQPSKEELDHDFLWRVARALPERGRIGIFNRSHYEEVLVVRVHPEFLDSQRLPRREPDLFEERYDSIRDMERHLYRNGTIVLKFWLNVSRDEQRRRFLDRIDDPDARWKFAAGDVEERGHWDAYMDAYQQALNATSRPWAPWYAVPADDKATMRAIVAETVVKTLEALPLKWPRPDKEEEAEMARLRVLLEAEDE
ncbi:MAG: polyphosphate kinase 2 family protein [Pseudomonadota bacterium]|nr:polyphosphate kinase 2 family protein [Pseudomonadota bacterium]